MEEEEAAVSVVSSSDRTQPAKVPDIAHINKHLCVVKELYELFLAAETDHTRWLSELLCSTDATDGVLLSSTIRKCFSRILSGSRASLMFTGANSSGKSTLLNALIGHLVLPSGSGHVSRRVCKLSHASWDNACIRFLRLNDTENCLDLLPELQPISLTEYRDKPKELMELMAVHLTGKKDDEPSKKEKELKESLEDEEPSNEKERKELLEEEPGKMEQTELQESFAEQERQKETESTEWLTTIVEVRFPFDGGLISAELDLYDVPGFSKADNPQVQEFMKLFIRIIKPVPVFVYANPTISDAEISCLTNLQTLLGLSAKGAGDESLLDIFFASTHFDRSSIAYDRKIMLPKLTWEMIQDELSKRYALLRNSPSAKQLVDLPESLDRCRSFACVSALDFFSGNPTGRKIFQEFVDKLMLFATYAHQTLLNGVLNGLLRGTKLFFQGINSHKTRKLNDIKHDHNKAMHSLSLLQRDMEKRLGHIMKLVSTRIRDRVKSEDLRKRAMQAAQETSLSYDGKELAIYRREAAGAFKQKFIGWISENVIDHVMNGVRQELKNELGCAMEEFVNSTQDNILLKDVVKAEFPTMSFDHGTPKFSLMFPRTMSNFIYILVAGTIVGLPFLMAWSWLRNKGMIGEAFGVVDDKFKKTLAQEMLDKLEKKFSNMGQDMMTTVFQDALRMVQRMETEVNRRAQELSRMAEAWKLETAQKELEVRCNKFARIEALLLATRTSLTNSEAPSVNTDLPALGIGATAEVYPGRWNGHDVAVKMIRKDIICKADAQNMFFKEIHYGWLLTGDENDPSPYLLPLLGVYRDVNDENSWRLVYPRCRTNLRAFLDTHSKMLTVTGALRIGLCLVRAVQAMHKANIMHRDIKPENLFVMSIDDPLEVMLGDYGAATGASVANTLIGTLGYMAPEAHCSYTAPEISREPGQCRVYTKSADMYSVGKVLEELLFWMGMQASRLQPLIDKCLDSIPSRRPTASKLISAMEQFLTELKDQPSLIHYVVNDC